MAIYYKIGGVWTEVQRPYVKRSGVWTPVKEVWRKSGGVWAQNFLWDITPPGTPSLELNLVPTKNGRYINVGVNIPGPHDPNVKLIRVLTSPTAYPATQFGGNYTSQPDVNYPNEPWSDFYYGPGFHTSTATQVYKQFPNNPTSDSNVTAGNHYFSAWAQDINGNWSAAEKIFFTVPKSGVGSNQIVRNSHFQAQYSGSWVTGTGFVSGDLRQSINPTKSVGMFFYNGEFTTEIGSAYGNASAAITSAQIYLHRIDTDGAPTANVYIFRHPYVTPSGIVGTPTMTEVLKLGTISKGEGKWFPIPTTYYADIINSNSKGFGFFYQDPSKAAAFAEDYTVLLGITEDNRRQGEFYAAWTETPS